MHGIDLTAAVVRDDEDATRRLLTEMDRVLEDCLHRSNRLFMSGCWIGKIAPVPILDDRSILAMKVKEIPPHLPVLLLSSFQDA
jgi:hypothetical protein